MTTSTHARLVPELKVTDLLASLDFYVGVIGFEVSYERAEDDFVYLETNGAEIMLEEIVPGDRVAVAPLERPLGRGMNLQIRWPDLDGLLARLDAANIEPFLGPEVRTYQIGDAEVEQRQVWVQDPDGYLLRFAE